MSAAHFLGDEVQTYAYIEAAAARAHADHQTTLESIFVAARSMWRNVKSRYDDGLAAARHARHLAELAGNRNALAWAMAQEATSLAPREPEAAIALLHQALDLADANSLALAGFRAQSQLASLLTHTGRTTEAIEHVVSGLTTMRRRSSWMFVHQALLLAADLLHATGDNPTAAIVYGAVRASSMSHAPEVAAELQRLHRGLAQRLPGDDLNQLASSGEHTPIERIVSLAESALVTQQTNPEQTPSATLPEADGGREPRSTTTTR